ncbi:MAG: GNAT family N-acetyltransferase [Rhodospirillaceae bacterium]|nr:GNAT family N-acetyltransferase [Rhodospirillaceae bacterium]
MTAPDIPALPLPIVTRRLNIREYTAADTSALQENVREPEYWEHHATEPPSADKISALVLWAVQEQSLKPRINYYLAAARKDSGAIVGEAVLRITDPLHRQGEMGFGIGRKFWKQGYATEIGAALLHTAFHHFKLHRVFAQCAPENKAVIRVMQKLGMAREGMLRDVTHARGKWWSTVVYSIIDSEYAKISKLTQS